MSEKPVHLRPRRLADWLNPTGAKKVHSLVDKVYKRKNLEMAWETSQAQPGSGGVDGQSLDEFAEQARSAIESIAAKNSRPTAINHNRFGRRPIPKAGKPGKYRMLGIPDDL